MKIIFLIIILLIFTNLFLTETNQIQNNKGILINPHLNPIKKEFPKISKNNIQTQIKNSQIKLLKENKIQSLLDKVNFSYSIPMFIFLINILLLFAKSVFLKSNILSCPTRIFRFKNFLKFGVTSINLTKFHTKSIILPMLLLLLINKAKSLTIPQGHTFGDFNDEYGRAIEVLPENKGYILVGNIMKVEEGYQTSIVFRVSETGTELWRLEVGCQAPYESNLADVILTKGQDNIVVAGYTRNECYDFSDPMQIPVFYVISFEGTLQHTQIITDIGQNINAIKAMNNGYYIVVGTTLSSGQYKGYLEIIHETGNNLGYSEFQDFYEITDIDLSDPLNFYVVGVSSDNSGITKKGIIQIIERNSLIALSPIIRFDASWYSSIARSSINTNFIVTGWRIQADNNIGIICSFNDNLQSLWCIDIGVNESDLVRLQALKEMASGNFVFVGTYRFNLKTKVFVVTTNENGAVIQQSVDHYRTIGWAYDVVINGDDGTVGIVGETDTDSNMMDFYFVQIPGCGEGRILDKSDDNLCICKAGYVDVDGTGRCVVDNDNTKSCKTVNVCRDKRENVGICNGKCTCNTDFDWDTNAKKCLGTNNGVSYCLLDSDCKDQLPFGKCDNNKCVCMNPYLYKAEAKKCRIHNDNTINCSGIDECMDDNILRATCDGKCKCFDRYEYNPDKRICAGYNTGNTICGNTTDCIDDTPVATLCIGGFCTCGIRHIFDPITKRCLCNKGTFSTNPIGYRFCNNCGSGSYQDQIGQSSCKKCPVDTFSSLSGRTSINDCNPCIPHSHSNEGSSSCPCDTGFYKTSTPTTCAPCHSFCKTCIMTSKRCSECNTIPGVYKKLNECLCDTFNGYYINHIADNVDECLKCPKYCGRCDNPSKCLSCEDHPGVIMNEFDICECKAPGYHEYIDLQSTDYYKEKCVKCDPLCYFCDQLNINKCLDCDSSKNAIFVEPYKCGCPSHFFYDSNTDKCRECNALCNNCHALGNNNCDGCNANIALAVDQQENLCVNDCFSIESYFRNNTQCSKCHENCLQCYGSNINQCTKCKNLELFAYNGLCVIECPSHYFSNEDNVCLECHKSCLNCIKSGINGCSSCQNNMYLYENTCVNLCPDSSFLDYNSRKCIPCKNPCKKCINENECLTCAKGFYLYSMKSYKCVTSELCGLFRYGDDKTKKCEDCHFSCLTCAGPSNTECIDCNFITGYSRANVMNDCFLLSCENGFFLQVDYSNKTIKCQKCHESCLNCLGPTNSNCTECKSGLNSMPTEIQNQIACLSCEEVSPGFTSGEDGKCHEKCGDGKNLGELKCDDGNLLNGDGCNHECRIEYGFKCLRRYLEPDFCYDYLEPTASLIVWKPNVLIVEFSEPVKILADSENLVKNWMNIAIDFSRELCNVEKNADQYLNENSVLTRLRINLDLDCTLKGGLEKFNLTFVDTEKITDLYGNYLSTKNLYANSLRFLYISDQQKAAIEATGTAFSVSTFTTFGLVIGMSMLQSAAVGSFWTFVNMLQMIAYIPILKCEIPYNLQVFLTQYMSVSKVVFPLKLLPNFVLNPLNILKAFITESIGENFEICGYETFSFIWNFGEELITWIFLLMFYLFLKLLDSCLPAGRFEIIRKWKKDYEFNTVIRVLIECFMNLVFCSFLNIWIAHPYNLANKISLVASILAAMLVCGFLMTSLYLVETRRKQRRKAEFIETYGTIIEDLKIGIRKAHFTNRYYYPFFMIRRLFYAVILITLIDYPYIQIGFITILIVSPMIFYLIYCMPFKQNITNYINIYNELTLFIAYFGILINNIVELKDYAKLVCGWIIITLILVSLAVTWITMLPSTFKELLNNVRETFFGSEDQQHQLSQQNTRNVELNKENGCEELKTQNVDQTNTNLNIKDLTDTKQEIKRPENVEKLSKIGESK